MTLVHPKPFHTAKQCEEGSDSHVNKVLETIDIEYTKNYYNTTRTSRHCTHTGISTSTAGIPTIRLFGSLGICVKNVDTSGGEIVLSPRMFSPKSWVWSWVIPVKTHEWIAIETLGEYCQSISRVSELRPCS